MPTAASGPPRSARNWKCVPTGMDTQVPERNRTVSSRPACRRHIWPFPFRMYQISSTERWATARATRPACSSKCAIEPRASWSSTRTSEPSGATASGSFGSCMVSNRSSMGWQDIGWPIRRRLARIRVMEHLSRERLEAGLDHVRESPQDRGRLVLLVRRPEVGQRDLPEEAVLDQVTGLEGDNWLTRGSSSTPDRSAHPDKQVTVINARLAKLVAGGTERMALAGDQLYLDLDLSVDNLPAGSLLAVGDAVLRVSEAPHTGCAKFIERFGTEAIRFVNSRIGRRLRLRGMNTRIVVPGTVRLGDLAVKAGAQPVPVAQATATTANQA